METAVATGAAAQAAIEREGMARARARAAVADVTLLLVDLEAALQDASALEAVEALFDSRAILLLNKADRCEAAAVRRPCEALQDRNPVVISAQTGEGLDLSLGSCVEVAGTGLGGGEGAGGRSRRDAAAGRSRGRAAGCLSAGGGGGAVRFPGDPAVEQGGPLRRGGGTAALRVSAGPQPRRDLGQDRGGIGLEPGASRRSGRQGLRWWRRGGCRHHPPAPPAGAGGLSRGPVTRANGRAAGAAGGGAAPRSAGSRPQ